jgi:hypothetical protein
MISSFCIAILGLLRFGFVVLYDQIAVCVVCAPDLEPSRRCAGVVQNSS